MQHLILDPPNSREWAAYRRSVRDQGGDFLQPREAMRCVNALAKFGRFGRVQMFAGVSSLNSSLVPMLDPLGLGQALGYNWAEADYVAAWDGSKCGLGNATNSTRYCDIRIPHNRVFSSANTGAFGLVVTSTPTPTGIETDMGGYTTSPVYGALIRANFLETGLYKAVGFAQADALSSVSFRVQSASPNNVTGLYYCSRPDSSNLTVRTNASVPTTLARSTSGAWSSSVMTTHARGVGATSEYSKKTISTAFTLLDGAVLTDAEYTAFFSILRDYHAALGVPTSIFA